MSNFKPEDRAYTFDRTAGIRSPVAECAIVSMFSQNVASVSIPSVGGLPMFVSVDELFHTEKEAYQYQQRLVATEIDKLQDFSKHLEQLIGESEDE